MPAYEWTLVGSLPVISGGSFQQGYYSPGAYSSDSGALRWMMDGDTEVLYSDDGLETSAAFTTSGAMGNYVDMAVTYDGADTWFYTVAGDQYIYYNYVGDNALYLDYTGHASDDFFASLLAYDASTTRWGTDYLTLAAGYINSIASYGIIKIVSGTPTVVQNTGSTRIGRIRDNGSIFVAMPRGTETTAYYTSANGTTWTARTLPATCRSNHNFFELLEGVFTYISYRPGSNEYFHTSTDGINWTTKALPFAAYGAQMSSDGAGGLLVTDSSQVFYRSTDSGDSWTEVPLVVALYSDWVPTIFDGANFKVIVNDGTTARKVYKLIDATPPETVWSNVVGCQIS